MPRYPSLIASGRWRWRERAADWHAKATRPTVAVGRKSVDPEWTIRTLGVGLRDGIFLDLGSCRSDDGSFRRAAGDGNHPARPRWPIGSASNSGGGEGAPTGF